jgi:hypothetical protein
VDMISKAPDISPFSQYRETGSLAELFLFVKEAPIIR